jgi:fluoride exporter
MLAFFTHPVVLLSIGGALGTNARYWLSVWIHDHKWTEQFPLATLLINVSGSLLLGLLVVPFHSRLPLWWILLGVGFCGGYTTFSTFALETVVLIHDKRQTELAVLNVLLSVVLSCAAMWIALMGIRSIYPPPPVQPPIMEAADRETRTEP